MAANMGKPCPPDPVWYREHHAMEVTCLGCGHTASKLVREWAAGRRRDLKLYEVQALMRCTRCGAKKVQVSVI